MQLLKDRFVIQKLTLIRNGQVATGNGMRISVYTID